jgi:uncharacterized protein YukE
MVAVGSPPVAHSFDDLVTMQRSADQAHATVEHLRDEYGKPTTAWTEQQTAAYDEAWKAWRDAATAVQATVTGYAAAEGRPRNEVEADVKKAARHPEPADV